MFDAYSVKKILPRLVIAVIGIQLSWIIFTNVIYIVNLIAYGIEGLIYAPFGGASHLTLANILSTGNGTSGLFAGLVGATALGAVGAAVSLGGVVSLALTCLLAIFIGFTMLVLRRVLIIFLLVLAPVALVAWIIPGTEKYWKLWWESFFKLLLLYPMIIGVVAVGRVFAYIAVQPSQGNSGGAAAISSISQLLIVLVGVFGPFFLIPKLFTLAGSAFANLTGAVNNRSKGAFDRLRNRRQQTQKRNLENLQAGKRFKGNNAFTRRANSALMTASLAKEAGFNPAKARARIRAARSERISALSGKAMESEAVQAVANNDDLLNAALSGDGTEAAVRQYLAGHLGQTGRELDQNVASVMRAKQAMGKVAFEDFAAANLAGTGTGYESGPAEMLETINRVAGNDSARAARILASARSQAEKARRVDLYGAGFATSADQMSQLRTGQTTAAAVNDVMTDEALRTKSAYEIGGARNNAFTNMQGAIMRRLENAQYGVDAADSALRTARASGNQTLINQAQQTYDEAVHNHKRTAAQSSAFLEMAAGASPENNELIGAMLGQGSGRGQTVPERYVTRQATDANTGQPAIDRATGQPVMETVPVGSREETLGDMFESLDGDAEFKQYKKTYSNAQQAAAARAAQQQGQPGPLQPPSDRRLKTNIVYLETLDSGIKIYSFKYIWGGPAYVGVMAQDLLDYFPEAVITDKSGFYLVNYAMLGLRMVRLEVWQKSKQAITR